MPIVRTMADRDGSLAVEPKLPPFHDASPTSTPTTSPSEDTVDDVRLSSTSTFENPSLLPITFPLPAVYPDRPALNRYRPPSKMPHLGQGWNRIVHSIHDVPDSWREREFSIDSPVWSDRMGIKGLYIVGGIWIGWLLAVWLKGNLQSLNEWVWARNHTKQRRISPEKRGDDSEWDKAYRNFKNREEARRAERRLSHRNHAVGREARRSIEPAFSAPRAVGSVPTVTVLEEDEEIRGTGIGGLG